MKNTGVRFLSAIFTLALASGAASVTGCDGGIIAVETLCDDVCKCQRCTGNDLQACKDKGSAAGDAADAAGCSDQFAAAVTCTSAHVSCKGDQAVAEGCDAELTALSKCSNTLSVFGKNACQLAADQITAQLAACPKPPTDTSTSSGGGEVECTAALGQLATCQAAAIAPVSCNCLGAGDATLCTSEELTSFSNAIGLCK